MVPGEHSIEPVLAGSEDFVALVSPEVTSRVGAAPRVAADPRQAFRICSEQGGLLVLQYAGPDWLPVVRDLRSLCGGDIAMVVAVAPEQVAEVAGLQHAGADEVVVWEGQVQSVSWAVERVLAGRAQPAPPPPRPAPPRAPAPQGRTDVFEARLDAPPVLQRAAPGSTPVPAAPASFTIREAAPAAQSPAAGAAGAWPSGVLADADAARLLGLAVSGATPGEGQAAAAATRLAAGLTAPEASALAGAPVPLDAALLRRLAALRLRLAVALESAPGPGSPHDPSAVQSLLAEVDGGLAELKAAGDASTPEVQAAAEQIRNAVVGAAIDLTEVVQRIAPAGAVPAPAAPAARAGPATRVLSNRAEGAPDAPRRIRAGWLVTLALAALATAAFHGHKLMTRKPPVAPPAVGGAPSGTLSVREKNVTLVVREPGKTIDTKQLESFKVMEEARGHVVTEVAPGVVISQPDPDKKETQP